ncbi:hypothetical protein Vadar_018949 [Vaccinium darrowii]|uniref:Uncharacterized protein n=1 Tax=Vaccinium darrowii TaxID=229202 RepID=A0ACB7YEK1_9ERIC|nr:hypothetical protein Vadar_018949 [Vaccinium darrowii]
MEANHGSSSNIMLTELGKLTQLGRLNLLRLSKEDGKVLCSSLEKLSSLYSLCVHAKDENEIIDLDSLSSAPQRLRLLDLCGRLQNLPHWIPSLHNLTRIFLWWSKLRDDGPLQLLQHLPNLVSLDLLSACQGDELCFKAGGFRKLVKLVLCSFEELRWVRVEAGSMPLLKELQITKCNLMTKVPSGIEHLTNLKLLLLSDMSDILISSLNRNLEGGDYWKIALIPEVWILDSKSGSWKGTLEPKSCFHMSEPKSLHSHHTVEDPSIEYSSENMETLSISSPDQALSSNSSNSTPEGMSVMEKFRIVRSVGEECIHEDELRNLLSNNPEPVCYDGFEPSGRMHIAQGIMKIISVNKMTSAGCRVKFWIADWFAKMNNKMGGDLEKIKDVGDYIIEVWKAAGLNLQGGKVEFIWSSKEINSRASEYWPLVMDIASRNTLSRIKRCAPIMGRGEADELMAAQRKVNVLAREYCDLDKSKNKPIILSHHMLPGLKEGQEKMSKSDPSSSIFMEDEEAVVNLKIKKAYCPPMVVQGNPCVEYIEHIILPWFHEFKVERSADNGGEKTFKSFEELVADYESGNLHPADVKPALSKALNKILQPVREHFNIDPTAKDLLRKVKRYQVTS